MDSEIQESEKVTPKEYLTLPQIHILREQVNSAETSHDMMALLDSADAYVKENQTADEEYQLMFDLAQKCYLMNSDKLRFSENTKAFGVVLLTVSMAAYFGFLGVFEGTVMQQGSSLNALLSGDKGPSKA